MAINRILNPFYASNKKSFFLFGARTTGKSWLLRSLLPKNTLYINLLSHNVFLRLESDHGDLQKMCSDYSLIVIDEVQKIPTLLDEVHRLIEEEGKYFLLTGSSARKLKRSKANMLGGRAGLMNLFPLVSKELDKNFNLKKYLNRGGLPNVYFSDDPELELDSYTQLYLEQEIQLESNVRNLPPFARFLKSAALSNGQLLNYSELSSDCGLSANTIREYYQILEDTLIGYKLEPWLESKKRKAITTAKFYFFDIGVRNYICNFKNIEENTAEWGNLFEHFIFLELKAYLSYTRSRKKIYFWRNTSKHEVDLIIDNEIAFEIKSTRKVGTNHLNGLRALQEEKIVKKLFIISNDPIDRTIDGIKTLYWKNFLMKLWNNELI